MHRLPDESGFVILKSNGAGLEYNDSTLAELERWLGRDSNSLSSVARRLREKAKSDDRLKGDMDALKMQVAKLATLQA